MNVLVTGGAGYIGSHTVQALLQADHNVFVYDNLSTGFLEAVPIQAKFIEGDILDTNLLTQSLQNNLIQAVIHFAAKLIVPESLEKPVDYYKNNVGGVISLAAACQKAAVLKVIFSSTAAVYGESKVKGLISETSKTQPINPYGASKLMCERVLQDCELGYGLKSVCLRYFNVAGASIDGGNGQRSKNATHLVSVAAKTALGKRSSLDVFGTDFETPDGSGVRDYIHVQDLADLHVLALKYLEQKGASSVFNCGYQMGFSVIQVIEAMKNVSKTDLKVQYVGRRAGDPASLVADSSKVQKAFNWSPKYDDINLICRTAFEWEKKRS